PYWQRAFGGSNSAVGRTIHLNGQPFTIVGVAEPGFTGLTPGRRWDLWLPIAARPIVMPRWTPRDDDSGSWWLVIVGRPMPGVSTKQLQAAVSLLFADETLHDEKPLFASTDASGIDVVPAQQGLAGGRKNFLKPLYVLMMTVALVLLITCANIGGLLLARAAGRTREMALRLTLGARRGRLVAQLLVESLSLSLLGGGLGLVVAHWGAQGLLLMSTRDEIGSPPFTPHLDLRVLAFTAAVTVLTGVIFGLVPALRSLRVDLTPALKAGNGASDSGVPRSKWYGMGNTLVFAQVSLAIIALISAGLLARTLGKLKSVDLGFDAENLLVFGLDPALAGYKGPQIDALNRDLQQQIAALPGVTA